jgi:hypothetical protein
MSEKYGMHSEVRQIQMISKDTKKDAAMTAVAYSNLL